VRNELTKFGTNPTTFEPPITGLKMTGSEPPNLDKFPFSFFFLSSHVVVCVFCSLPSHSSSYLSAQLRMEARIFSLLSFLGSISTVDSNQNQRCTSTGFVGYFCWAQLHPPCGGIAQQKQSTIIVKRNFPFHIMRSNTARICSKDVKRGSGDPAAQFHSWHITGKASESRVNHVRKQLTSVHYICWCKTEA